MAQIIIETTDEQTKAVNGIVIDHQAWLQAAWDGKAASCTKKVIIEESNLNPSKMNEEEKKNWVRDNEVKTRKDKDKKE